MVAYADFREVKYFPLEVPEEYKPIFFIDEHQRIGRVLDIIATGYLSTTNVAPAHPRDGDVRFADGVNWNPGSGRGTYRFDGDLVEWVLQTGVSKVVTKTADYTVTDADDVILADASSGTITITLPTAVNASSRKYHIKKINQLNSVIIDGNGTQTIDGDTTKTISLRYTSLTIVSDNANWHII